MDARWPIWPPPKSVLLVFAKQDWVVVEHHFFGKYGSLAPRSMVRIFHVPTWMDFLGVRRCVSFPAPLQVWLGNVVISIAGAPSLTRFVVWFPFVNVFLTCSFLQGGVVSPTPNPQPSGPGTALVCLLPFDLSSLVEPTRSIKTPSGRVSGVRKPLHHGKVEVEERSKYTSIKSEGSKFDCWKLHFMVTDSKQRQYKILTVRFH